MGSGSNIVILPNDVPCIFRLLDRTYESKNASNGSKLAEAKQNITIKETKSTTVPFPIVTNGPKRLKTSSSAKNNDILKGENLADESITLPGISALELQSIPMIYLAINKVLAVIIETHLLIKAQASNRITESESSCINHDSISTCVPHSIPHTSEKINASLEEMSQLHTYIWEQLNVGHWKCVPRLWRKLYTCVALLKVSLLSLNNGSCLEIIHECDMGLLMGEPICNNVLSEIAEAVNNKIVTSLTEGVKDVCSVESKSEPSHVLKNKSRSEFLITEAYKPSLETFLLYMKTDTPVLLSGIIDHWPALTKWNVDYIQKVAGFRTVPVEIGHKYTSEDWTQQLMSLNDFIVKYMRPTSSSSQPNKIGYVAQHNLFHQLPLLRQDIRIPEYCSLGSDEDVDINAWFGPSNTISPTHYDPKHNILVQIFGNKIIRLFPPSESIKLRPYPEKSLLFNTSQFDVEEDGLLENHPEFMDIKHCDVILNSGQALFIPKSWWHYVKSTSASFSVSFWFQ